MQFIIIPAVSFIFIKTASYSLWEKNKNHNLTGAISVFILGACTLAAITRFI